MSVVLVVDDAEFLRLRMTKILVANGYEVLQADNGNSAVAVYQQAHPDVVLMDVTMPDMDGLTALQTIRTLDPAARVVMLTALDQETVVAEARQAGAQYFVSKPFEAQQVLSAITHVLA
jgi:two-component system, chemotaxis family, chemotaxis protein CheY